jgi:hypothetical protein
MLSNSGITNKVRILMGCQVPDLVRFWALLEQLELKNQDHWNGLSGKLKPLFGKNIP